MVGNRGRRARKLIWLTPESLQAAERLAGLTGMAVPDLIELVLLELTDYEMPEAARARSRPAAAPAPPAPPAHVIPIDRARAARRRPLEAVIPRAMAPEDLADLHTQCSHVRALAERARVAAVQARTRARAVLEGRGAED